MIKKDFNWGHSDQTYIDFVSKEIFTDHMYEEFFPVQPGDIVLDLGASTGPFTWSVMDKASKVYAIEPMSDRCQVIDINTQGYNVEIVKGIVYHSNGNIKFNDGCILTDQEEIVKTFTFKSFLEKYNINKIDFIKTDCEGGEYYMFKEENMDFLLNNVRNIVGEIHLSNPELKVEFRYWRDKYLKHFPNFEVRSVDGVDIKWDLYNDHFIEYYNEVFFHINNF